MRRVYFKTDTSGPVRLFCTADGKIDFSELGQKLKLDPASIDLNGDRLPKEGVKSEFKWETIEEAFKEDGLPVGTKEDPVIVTGEAPVSKGLRARKRRHVDASLGLRARKRRLVDASLGLRARKRRPVDASIQEFVSSAAASYKRWKQDYEQALESHKKAVEKAVGEVADVKMHRPFLKLEADPLGNFPGGILLWVRTCYTDMKDIMSAAAPFERFTILGTSGIGKSMFSVFWICYQATLKQKVVWKLGDDFHLLDFTREDSPMASTFSHPLDVLEVLNDENTWLVIDGAQMKPVSWKCHVLQVCSMKKENYHEYAKNHRVKVRYFPVWEKEEVCEFLDEFEQHRSNWQEMQVPVKDEALRYFETIGGIPRFVLCGSHSVNRLGYIEKSMKEVGKDEALQLFIGNFEGRAKGDALVHIKCGEGEDSENDKYSRAVFDFASIFVRNLFAQQFQELSKRKLVKFMRAYANDTSIGNLYGFMFELVGHLLIKQGGLFQMKKVTQGGPAKGTEVDSLKLSEKKLVYFDSWGKFPEFKSDGYYRPTPANFKSIDGVLHPDLLLQFFSRTHSPHGYIVQGLQDAASALGLTKLRVCACVPKDKYEQTGFQPWLTTGKTKYIGALPKVILDSEQYVIAIDFNKVMSP